MTSSGLRFSEEAIGVLVEKLISQQNSLQNAVDTIESRLAILEAQPQQSQTLAADICQLQNDVAGLKAKDETLRERQIRDDVAGLTAKDEGSKFQGALTGKSQQELSGQLLGIAPSSPLKPSFQQINFTFIAKKREYEFAPSVYDAILFVGEKFLSPTCQVLICVGCILNMVMQLGVVSMISREFTDEPFAPVEVDRFRYWRAAEGHSYLRADPVSGQSLVARVCGDDPALPMAFVQRSAHEQVQGYLHMGAGHFLCNISILLWSFCCCVELRMTVQLVLAFWILPRDPRRSQISADELSIQLAVVSHGRLLLAFLVALCRGVIAICLLYYGSIWLVNTDNIEGLLLNASALSFVLDIDETIYRVFASSLLVGVMSSIKPIKLPARKSVEFIPVSFLICIVGALLIMNFTFMLPVIDSFEQVHGVLCAEDSNLDFIVGQNALGWLIYAKSAPFEAESTEVEDLGSNVRLEAIKLLIDKDPRGNMYAFDVSQTDVGKNLGYIKQTVGSTLSVLTQERQCFDWNPALANGAGLGALLYVATSNESFKQLEACDEVQEYCRDNLPIVSQNVRFMCPVMCGCADPLSGLWDLAAPEAGCPRENCDKQMTLVSSPDHTCKDMDLEQLKSMKWMSLLTRMQQFAAGTEKQQFGGLNTSVFNDLRRMGCEALIHLDDVTRGNLCAHSNSFFGVGFMCPVVCGCLPGNRLYLSDLVKDRYSISCPLSCRHLYQCVTYTAAESAALEGIKCPETCEETLLLDHFECPLTCNETLSGEKGSGYRGCRNVTRGGYTCQMWTSQQPHEHSRTPDAYRGKGLGHHNYCRNPDIGESLWCYTADPTNRFDRCDPVCVDEEDEGPSICNETLSGEKGSGYRGCQNVTRSGYTCQMWTSQQPHEHSRTPCAYPEKGLGHHNYCRNPDNGKSLWCYTADPDKRYDFCDPVRVSTTKAMTNESQ